MNFDLKTSFLSALCCVMCAPAMAQQAPAEPPAAAPASVVAKPTSSAQADAGEPRAHTSAPAEPSAGSPAVATSPAATSAAAKPTAASAKGKAAAAATQKPVGAADRLDLGTATVTGDREQPKVMYIVPWKSSTMGDLAGKPMNSLVDEILAPVDRDVFKREVTYYQAVQSDASQNGASAKPSPRGEK